MLELVCFMKNIFEMMGLFITTNFGQAIDNVESYQRFFPHPKFVSPNNYTRYNNLIGTIAYDS
jgi:hypothetical protein